MSLYDCGRCGASFPSDEKFQDHRRDAHGIQEKAYPGTPQSSHEKNLNGHRSATDVRRDPRRGQGTGGNRAVD